MFKSPLLSISLTSVLLAAPAFAASDYYLKIEGVDGESTKAATSTAEVTSFSWGASNASVQAQPGTRAAVSPHGAGSGLATGKRQHKPVTVPPADGKADPVRVAAAKDALKSVSVVMTGPGSATSQALDRACATGKHIKSAELGGRGERYQMTDVVVSSCAVTGNARHYELRGHVTLIR